MIETKIVYVSHIKYKDNMKYLNVCGGLQLEQFVKNNSMSCYDYKSAPTEIQLLVKADFSSSNVYDIIQNQAEEELGLEILSCAISF